MIECLFSENKMVKSPDLLCHFSSNLSDKRANYALIHLQNITNNINQKIF